MELALRMLSAALIHRSASDVHDQSVKQATEGTMNSARRGWSRPLSLAAVAGLTLAAAGCGGGDASSSDDVASLGTDTASSDATDESTRGSEPPKDPEEAMLAFTECMRDQGVDMPDPAPPGQGGGRAVEIKVDPASDKFE